MYSLHVWDLFLHCRAMQAWMEWCLQPCLGFGWFVCLQNFWITEWILVKLGGMMGEGLRNNQLHFGTNTANFYHFHQHCKLDRFHICVNFSVQHHCLKTSINFNLKIFCLLGQYYTECHYWIVKQITFGGSPILWKRCPTLGTFSRANLFPRDFTLSMAL